jgi:hypothetical protein
MLRFLRKYMRHILVVAMALLLVSWLGGSSLRYLLTKDLTTAVIGKAFGKDITRADLIRVENQTNLYNRLGLRWQRPWQGMWGPIPLPSLDLIDWLLLQQEANQWPLEISARQIDEEFNRRGLNDAALVMLQERLRVARQDLRDAMASFLRVWQRYLLCESSVKVTETEVRHTCKQFGDKVKARFVVLNADDFLNPDEPVTEEDASAHFEKYKDRPQGGLADDPQALPFGYQYPNQIQVEYIVLNADALAQGLPVPKATEIYAYYQQNKNALTTTRAAAATQAATTADTQAVTRPETTVERVMTLDEAEPQIIETLNREKAIQLAHHEMQQMLDATRSAWAAAPVDEKRMRQMPESITTADYYPKLVQASNQGKPNQPFQYHKTDWLTVETAAEVEGLGNSVAALSDGSRIPFTDQAFRVYGLKLPEEAGTLLSLYEEPTEVFADEAGNAYMFRVVAARPPESPADWTEVRQAVEEDVRKLSAYRRAEQAAQRILEAAQTEGLEQAFTQDQAYAALEEKRDQVLRNPAPFARARLASFQEAFITGKALMPPTIPGFGPQPDQELADAVFEQAAKTETTTATTTSPTTIPTTTPATDVHLLSQPQRLRCVLFQVTDRIPMRQDEYESQRMMVRSILSVVRRLQFAINWWHRSNIRQRTGLESPIIDTTPEGPGSLPG